MGRIIEGLWDCKYCNTKDIKGRFRECPNCGKPRDKDTTFRMPNQISYVPEEEARKISKNPDWMCSYCNSLNPDSSNTCKSCGAERTSENLDYFSNKAKRELKTKTTSSYYDDINQEDEDENNFSDYSHGNNYTDYSHNNKSGSNFFKDNWKLLTAIPLIIALIVGMFFLFAPKEEEILIDSFKWDRSIEIERYQAVQESDWTMPPNARLLYSNLEFSHYQEVLDHYETKTREVPVERQVGTVEVVTGHRDLGNGYFEEITEDQPVYETFYETEYYEEAVYKDEPVYLMKYYYEIDKWLYERSVNTNGKDKNAYWGEVKLNDDERVSSKNQTYYIIGTDKKEKIRELRIDYGSWLKLEVNQNVKVKVSVFGSCELIE